MTCNPLMVVEYSRCIMAETIMAVHGASQPNPEAFRRWLNSLSYEDLYEEYENLKLTNNRKNQ